MSRPRSSPLRAARPLPGARACFGAVLVSMVLAALATPAHAARRDPGMPPPELPWRVGGRVGFTVDAASFPDSSGTVLDVYVRIPPSTLEAMELDSLGRGRLTMTVRLRLPTGGRVPESRQELSFTREDATSGFGKVVVMRYPTVPGRHRLKVKIEDVQTHKTGIAYLGRPAPESADLEGDFTVPKPQAGRSISDLEFVWSERDSSNGTGLFQRGGHTLLPNPERLYGLYASDLHAFFIARGPAVDGRPWRWVARVLDAAGEPVVAQESTGTASEWLAGGCTLDISTLPAGGYDLEVKVWQEGDAGALTRRAHFSVAWQPLSWHRNPLDFEDDVHLLFDADGEERFARLHPGEQERELDEFWKRRDPTPETALNEARETFRQRVAVADQLYGRQGLMRGMFSDMGRVFIRYGEPTEVTHQVIPAGDETARRVMQDLELADDRPTGDVHQKGIGGDQRPFEVWVYEAPVPAPIDADPSVRVAQRRRRLLFVFVDEQGLGHFTLRYSTE